MNFPELLAEDRRLSLLLLLSKAPASRCNSYVLHTGLQAMGHACSSAQVETDAAWLAEQGLVATERLGSMLVLTLTPRGDDVAHGRAEQPGVKRPVPGV